MVKGKAKAAEVRVPQNRDEAAAMLDEYGATVRELERLEADMNDELALAKAGYLLKAKPQANAAAALLKGLQIFCDANRTALLGNSGTKTANLGTGKVSWRWNPSSVTVRGKVDDIVARIKAAGDAYQKFLRPSVTLDKVAMLNDPNLAKTIEGIKIESAGEMFNAEPFANEKLLTEAAQ